MKIAVVMGGISSEREISLKSGQAVLNALLELGYDAYPMVLNKEDMMEKLTTWDYDLAYLVLHGEYGEDGRVQAVLDIIGKPYTGSGFTASAVSMDKVITKKIVEAAGVRVAKSFNSVRETKKENYPIVIKPALEGSSVGLYICQTKKSAEEAVKALEGKKIVIEEFVKGEELTVGVLDKEALGVLKIKPKSGVYDFKSKYTKGETEYEYPAKIDKKLYKEAMKISEKAYEVLELNGAARVDLILLEDRLYFLEVNTIPGMTETSLLPKIASLKGYDFKGLVGKVIEKFAK